MNRTYRRAREADAIPRGVALAAIGATLVAAGLFSRRFSPDSSHPRIQRWYRELDKPDYKPPDPLFGAIWPVLQTAHSVGAYRLMRAPRSPQRDQAIGLWFADIMLTAGWAGVFFGGRRLTGAVWGAAALTATSVLYIERAARVDGAAAAFAAPFALWSVFGGAMSADLRRRNPDLDGADPR